MYNILVNFIIYLHLFHDFFTIIMVVYKLSNFGHFISKKCLIQVNYLLESLLII